jgi:tripartite-type tricarboxylate transporter receptor subunit TctC
MFFRSRSSSGSRLSHLAIVACSVLLSGLASASSFPVKPISIQVGFVPGGGNDFVARIIAKEMSTELGQPVTVENRPGAAGELAAGFVARSAADGYTILLGSNGALTISPTVREKLPYDPVTDLEPIGMMTKTPLVLAVRGDAKPNSVRELISLAKTSPGKLTYASSGMGTNLHLTAELFTARSETKILHIPYKGGSQANNDVISGQVDIIFSQVSVVHPLAKAGKLKALGITSDTRSPLFPEAPPIADTLPGFSSVSWNGLFVRAGTPDHIKQILYKAMVKALRNPTTIKLFAEQGLDPFEMDGPKTKKYLAEETAKWAKIIRDADIKF